VTDGDVAKDGERDGQPHGDRVRGDVEPVVEQQVADPGCRVAALVVWPRVAVEVGGVGNVEEHRDEVGNGQRGQEQVGGGDERSAGQHGNVHCVGRGPEDARDPNSLSSPLLSLHRI